MTPRPMASAACSSVAMRRWATTRPLTSLPWMLAETSSLGVVTAWPVAITTASCSVVPVLHNVGRVRS